MLGGSALCVSVDCHGTRQRTDFALFSSVTPLLRLMVLVVQGPSFLPRSDFRLVLVVSGDRNREVVKPVTGQAAPLAKQLLRHS